MIKNCKKVLNLDKEHINKAIIKSIKIKSYFVNLDEKELLITPSSRAMLNFGHTFGHALESMNNYNNQLTHGEAISIGMSLAIKISTKINSIKNDAYFEFIKHLKEVNLPYFDERINNPEIYKIILSDKKNTDNKINLILLKDIGSAYFERGLNRDDIKKLLN